MRNLLKDERGGVFAEAVIALPVFVLAYSLIIFVHDGFDQAHVEGKFARAHAMDHALRRACEGESGDETTRTDAVSPTSGVVDAVVFGAFGASMVPIIADVPGLIAWGFEGGGYGGQLASYTFSQYSYRRSGEIERPLIGGSAQYGAQIAHRCNEEGIDRGRNAFWGTEATLLRWYETVRP